MSLKAAFDPASVELTRVSSTYRRALVVSYLVGWLIPLIVVVAAPLAGNHFMDEPVPWWAWTGIPAVLIGCALSAGAALIGASRVGYSETSSHIVVTRGVLFRDLVEVPISRLQYVDVSSGPIDQMFGLASVQLNTAAASTDAAIPGLVKADADALRDRLAHQLRDQPELSADPVTTASSSGGPAAVAPTAPHHITGTSAAAERCPPDPSAPAGGDDT